MGAAAERAIQTLKFSLLMIRRYFTARNIAECRLNIFAKLFTPAEIFRRRAISRCFTARIFIKKCGACWCWGWAFDEAFSGCFAIGDLAEQKMPGGGHRMAAITRYDIAISNTAVVSLRRRSPILPPFRLYDITPGICASLLARNFCEFCAWLQQIFSPWWAIRGWY